MKVLLTGFEPFGKHEVNPSQLVVEYFAGMADPVPGAALILKVLPVEYARAGEMLCDLIRTYEPDAVVSLGVATRAHLSLERVALNLDDAAAPDNAGVLRTGERIDPNGPTAYFSTLPLESMRHAAASGGYPVRITNHAGAYLCNHVFYAARHALSQMGRTTPSGFIHVPPLGASWPEDAGRLWTLDDIIGAVRLGIETLCVLAAVNHGH